jgi:aldose 1-epimerase
MGIEKQSFGITKEGIAATLFILKNTNGMTVHFTDFGANIVKILVPDRNGNYDDVVLGYDDVTGYENNKPGFGSFIGRHANRIKNGVFELNGVVYELEKNNGNHNLHGGSKGYNKFMYEAKTFENEEELSIEFTRISPHMEQGFPGNLSIKLRYTLTNDNQLILEYYGVSDQDTLVNLTNHSYFNLAGHNSGSILEQKIWIKSNQFTPTDDELIPTGEILDISGTPMDFRELKAIGDDINADYVPLKIAGGYDHNYVLDKDKDGVLKVGKLVDEASGRTMEIYTDMPGMQLYTSNQLEKVKGKEDVVYEKWAGVCFETQYYPNSIHLPCFPSAILHAKEEYNFKTIYKFLVK